MPVLQAARRTHKVVGTHRVRCFGDGLHHQGLPCPDAKHELHPDQIESALATYDRNASPPSFSMSEPITKKMSFPALNELSLMSPFVVRAQIQNTFFRFLQNVYSWKETEFGRHASSGKMGQSESMAVKPSTSSPCKNI